ncbi:MAG TPA: RNA polymerase sigma factor [Sphingobacteriaceae bacterium]|nr:RNA polymerase sigma factor [Sphingobacteriaceae bacterium]
MDRENNLIEQIRAGDKKEIEHIYNQHREEFLAYADRFSIQTDEAVDIYQDSIIVLYENIMSQKLTSLTSSLKTYLFAIGKYKMLNSMKVKQPTEDITAYEYLLHEETDHEFLSKEENIEKMQTAYRKLGAKCREVLRLYYYENQSLQEIMQKLDYASKDVVKSQKSRCVKQIREILMNTRWTEKNS